VDLICEKYKMKVEAESAVCEHLEEYCKFREACIINFMTRERLREERRDSENGDTEDNCCCATSKENHG
jgi:hypothetical protein